RAPRTDAARSGLVLWGGWTLVTAAVFSFMTGIIHPYYTVALAPGIAATVAVGTAVLWSARASLAARACLAAIPASAAVTAWYLLDRAPAWYPALRVTVLI